MSDKAKRLLELYRENAEEIDFLNGELKKYGGSSAEIAAYLAEVRQRRDAALGYVLRAQRLICAVPDGRLRRLLRLRYIDGMLWEELAEEMGYCLRWVFRLHREALAYVAAASR